MTRVRVLGCLLALAAAMPAGAQELTRVYDDPIAPQSLGVNDFFARWPGGHVPYVYNPTNAPAIFADDGYLLSLLEDALSEWESAAGLHFEFMGVDALADISDFQDNVVVVGWAPLGGAAGIATASTGSATTADRTAIGYFPYRDGNIRFNLGANWDKGAAEYTERNFKQVALHESGHLIGFGHSDHYRSILFSNPYNNLTRLKPDDLTGVVDLYGLPDVQRLFGPWPLPAAGASTLVGVSPFMVLDSDTGSAVTTIDDSSTGNFALVRWQYNESSVSEMHWVLVDPDGDFHNGTVTQQDCPPSATCTSLQSVSQLDVLKSFPGTWRVYGLENGNLTQSLTLDVQTDPDWNRPPVASIGFDRTRSRQPVTVTGMVNVASDPEGDLVTVTWHVPGDGETEDALGASSGMSEKTMTFMENGDYEVFASVDDDWERYGTPGSGAEAGPGFRKVFRQMIHVGPVPFDGFSELPDIDDDGIPELAINAEGKNATPHPLFVKEPGTGAALAAAPVLDDDYDVLAQETVDIGGLAAVATLGFDGITIRVQLRDATDGSLLRNIGFLAAGWEPVDMVVAAVGGDITTEDIVVLARNRATGEIAAQVRESANGTFIKNVFFLNETWTPLQVVAVPDLQGGGSPELAVLATNPAGQIVAMVKDAATNGFIKNVFFLNANFRPIDLVVVPDLDGGTDPALALLAQNRTTGLIVTMIKDAATNVFIRNLFHLSNAFTALAVAYVPGYDANPGPEIAVLGVADTGKLAVQVKDAGTNTFITNLFPLGSTWEAKGMRAIADADGNSEPEIAVMARRKADGVTVVQVLDVETAAAKNVFVP